MGVTELIGNIFGAVKEFFGFQSRKLDLKNKEDIKKSEISREEQRLQDETNKLIAQKKLEEIRKQISE
jgi:hypothetical protein